jgi:hypothetical protein
MVLAKTQPCFLIGWLRSRTFLPDILLSFMSPTRHPCHPSFTIIPSFHVPCEFLPPWFRKEDLHWHDVV